MDAKIKDTHKKISSLKIQGARNITIAVSRALYDYAKRYKQENFLKDLSQAAEYLATARPTEPMTRNYVRVLISRIKKNPGQIEALREIVQQETERFLKDCSRASERIAKIGAKRIPDNSTILIHCHSSTLMGILKEAAKTKNIQVICLETRPRYQGRISAKELSKAGIPTTLVVDSAMHTFLKKADLVLVGADAICSNGAIINKIGTATLATCAHERKKPFYVVAEIYKFDPDTLEGQLEEIEERNPTEVGRIRGVKIRNPAFDATPPEHIDLLITEEGILSPYGVRDVFRSKYKVMQK